MKIDFDYRKKFGAGDKVTFSQKDYLCNQCLDDSDNMKKFIESKLKRSPKKKGEGKSAEKGAKSTKKGAKSTENGAKSPENGAQSPENGAQSPENGAQSPENGTSPPKPLSPTEKPAAPATSQVKSSGPITSTPAKAEINHLSSPTSDASDFSSDSK